MGSWGYKLFQNDDACDVRETYREKIIAGLSDLEAENAVILEFEMDCDSDLWLPLAVTQWRLGRLSERAKKCGLSAARRELGQLDEQWKTALIPRRREELLRAQQLLFSDMPGKKRLRMPWWAYRCPWETGNVLQYKVRYPRENNPFADRYVMLLLCGVSETPPGKIPCECLAVRLYNWHSRQAPVTVLEEILASPPEPIDFLSKSGTPLPTWTILPSDEMLRRGEMRRIAQHPFPRDKFEITAPKSPMNSTFDESIARTLANASEGGYKNL